MGITGLIPFLEKASRKTNVVEFSGCTAAIDSYCWLHKGAFACADKLARGEDTDIYIKYCLKYVTMLLSKNIKPILVFDGRHLAAKALTESKRRESRDISKKRAAELLKLGKVIRWFVNRTAIYVALASKHLQCFDVDECDVEKDSLVEEARSYIRRCVDITHKMALNLIKECRKRNVDCIVAPYEADAQLAYLNIKNIAQLVITEDSDLILFGCNKVIFKMDLDGTGTLVETAKLPLVMRCPIEQYSFDRFRQMCIMSGCDYLPSLPGIGLAKARQFITATQDPNIANALRKLPSYFNRSSLTVSDEYREAFLVAEATFKHQYVYDPIQRKMVRLTEPDDDNVETALCVNAGELLEPATAFQLALGNLDPFTLRPMDDWHPDRRDTTVQEKPKSESWKEEPVSKHPSIWSAEFTQHLEEECPWQRKVRQEPIIAAPLTRPRRKVVNMVAKYVPETQDQSLTIESLSNMYCVEPAEKKRKTDCDNNDISDSIAHTQSTFNKALLDDEISRELTEKEKSPILENKERSFKKSLKNGSYSMMKRLSKFTRTVLDEKNVVESKFFSPISSRDNSMTDPDTNMSKESIVIGDSPEKISRNPFKVKSVADINRIAEIEIQKYNDLNKAMEISTQNMDTLDSQLQGSQKENALVERQSLILGSDTRLNHSLDLSSQDSMIENTYPLETIVTPVDSQLSYGDSPSPLEPVAWSYRPPALSSQPVKPSSGFSSQPARPNGGHMKSACRVPGLRKTASLPANQPTLLARFGFQKKPVLKK